jgi:hypothetical protein
MIISCAHLQVQNPNSILHYFNTYPSSKVLCTQEIKLLLAEIILSSPVGTKSTCEQTFFFWLAKNSQNAMEKKLKNLVPKVVKKKCGKKNENITSIQLHFMQC